MAEAIVAVERVFKQKAEGRVAMPPKLYLNLPQYNGDFRAMPAWVEGAAGIKWVSVYPGNRERSLHTVVGTIILNDPRTGYPLAVMDGRYITDVRTGAAGGVAVRYMAKKDSKTVGLVGCGMQARTQLMAIHEVMPGVRLARAFDLRKSVADAFAAEMSALLKMEVRAAGSIEEAAEADIIATTTPSRAPVLKASQVRPGTHINAIGADAPGKEELDPAILKKARIIVDDLEQASHSGEVNVPLSKGLLSLSDIAGTLGEVVAGKLPGRVSNDDITVFDSTGIAVEDIACARLVYEKAVREKVGQWVRMGE